MGSFNQVCAVSNLPISWRDECRCVLVQRKVLAASSFSYNNQWKPLTYPIKGTYDDYGALKDIKETRFDRLLFDHFREEAILKEDESVDHMVFRNFREGKIEAFVKASERRVLYKSMLGLKIEGKHKPEWENALVAPMFIREDVYQDILRWDCDRWVENPFAKSLSYLVEDLLTYYRRFRPEEHEPEDEEEREDEILKLMRIKSDLFQQVQFLPSSQILWQIFKYPKFLPDDFVEEARGQILEFERFARIFEALGHGWHPRIVRTEDLNFHLLFQKRLLKLTEEAIRRFEEE